MLNSNLSNKADKSGYDRILVNKEVPGVPDSAFINANFVATKPEGSGNLCGYGFHNPGINGGFLFLDNSRNLMFLNNIGQQYTVDMSMSLQTTGGFSASEYRYFIISLRDSTVNSTELNIVYTRYDVNNWVNLSFNLFANNNVYVVTIQMQMSTTGAISFRNGKVYDVVNGGINTYNNPIILKIIGVK